MIGEVHYFCTFTTCVCCDDYWATTESRPRSKQYTISQTAKAHCCCNIPNNPCTIPTAHQPQYAESVLLQFWISGQRLKQLFLSVNQNLSNKLNSPDRSHYRPFLRTTFFFSKSCFTIIAFISYFTRQNLV